MTTKLDQFYLRQEEPARSTFLALSSHILTLDINISTELKYGFPFFSYKGKMFCYFWKDKKTTEPYIGIVEGHRINHPLLEKGNRSRMKILRINPNLDLPLPIINEILNEALDFYRNGIIKIKGKN